jgi:hypothetical protein
MPRPASDQTRESLSGSLWFLPLLMTLAARINVRPDGFLDPVLFHGSAEEARRLLLSVATATVGVFASARLPSGRSRNRMTSSSC